MGFDDIFKQKEFLFLMGHKKRGLYLLSGILLLTFFALGHILGGQQELNERMSNPFTNWINVPVLTSNYSGIELMEEDTEDQDFLDSFYIDNVIPYEITWFKALERGFNKSKKLTVRSISGQDPLLEIILAKENVIQSSIESRESCDLIVTEEAFDLLEYEISSSELLLPIYDNDYDDDHLTLLMSVSHIVKDLPSDADVLISDKLMRLLNSNAERSGYIDQSPRSSFYFMASNSRTEEDVLQMIPSNIIIDEFTKSDLQLNGSPLVIHRIELREKISFTHYREMQKHWHTKGIFSVIDFNCDSQPTVDINPYYYSLNFNDLSAVKSFRDYAKQKYDLLLSLAQVESRDNFYLISRLTSLLILLLVILSGFSIILYLQNIVSNHLEKIKPNLGTLKAFGLSDMKIGSLYIKIVSKFYILASAIAFVILVIYKSLQILFKRDFHFELLDLRLLVIWIFIYMLLYFLFKRLINRILFKSPGDLIYNR